MDGIPMIAQRRTVLDTILVDGAVDAGADLHEEFVVKDLIVEDDRVVDIEGQHIGGAMESLRGRIATSSMLQRSSRTCWRMPRRADDARLAKSLTDTASYRCHVHRHMRQSTHDVSNYNSHQMLFDTTMYA